MKFTATVLPDKKLVRCTKSFSKYNTQCEVVQYDNATDIADAIKRGVDALFNSKGVRV